MNQPLELRESATRYYTAYYRDTLGIPDWSAFVRRRGEDEIQERARRARLEALLGAGALRGRVLNVGCGTGGFNAAAEALPFAVDSVPATIREMVRVTRRGGAICVHTPNAWSFYEGHYKLFWAPFMPRPLARAYLRLRGRPVAYFETLRRLTRGAIVRGFAAAGVTELTFCDDDRPRETLGRARVRTGAYYRLSGVAPYLELVARKT